MIAKLGRTLLIAVLLGSAAVGHAQTGQSAVNVSQSPGASTSPGCAVDDSDTIHLAWADNPESSDTTVQFVYYARSADGGTTFEAPRRISTGVGEQARAREIRVLAAPAGVVAVAWWATVVEGDRSFLTAYLARSADAGATFAPAVATSLRFRLGNAAKEGFSNTTTLSIAAAADGTIGLLATVPDYFHGFNIYYARTIDGVTFSEPTRVSNYSLTIPRAASNALALLPSGNVYAVWTEGRGDFVDEIRDVFSSVSTDGGRTFSAPTKLGGVRGIVGSLVPTSDGLALLTQSQKNDRSPAITKLFRSHDGGKTFGSRVRITKADRYSHLHENSIDANADGVVAIAWTESAARPGHVNGIYVSVSRDGGKTFGDETLVEEGLFIDPPSLTVDSAGRIGVAFSSSTSSLADREVLFMKVVP